LTSNKEKELDELRKNVAAQEDRLGEALRIFNQLSQEQSKSPEGNGNVVLYETLNTAITILGDLLASYRNYTEELEERLKKSSRKIELLRGKEAENIENKMKRKRIH